MGKIVKSAVKSVGNVVGGAVNTVKDVASSPLGKAALIGGGLYASGGLSGLGLGGGAATSSLPSWAAGITDSQTLASLGLGGAGGAAAGGGLLGALGGLSTGQALGLGAGALALSGGLGNQPTSSTTTTSIDPQMKAAYLRNLEEARNVAAGLGEKQLADFTAKYGTAEQQLESLGLGGLGQQTTNQAATLALQEAGFTPQQIAAQTGSQYMSAYQNPYENQVVQGALGDIERQRQMSQQAQQARASAARAFGGSRQAVAEALANEDYTRQAANTAAQLRSQGFTTAAQLGQTDAARMLAAAQANQSAFAQGAGIRQGAIGQLGALGAQQQNLGMTGAQSVMNAQQQRQALAQARLDATRNLPLERLGISQGALSLQPANLGGTQTSPIYRNTGASALGGALSGGMLGNLIGGSTGAAYGALGGGLLGLL